MVYSSGIDIISVFGEHYIYLLGYAVWMNRPWVPLLGFKFKVLRSSKHQHYGDMSDDRFAEKKEYLVGEFLGEQMG